MNRASRSLNWCSIWRRSLKWRSPRKVWKPTGRQCPYWKWAVPHSKVICSASRWTAKRSADTYLHWNHTSSGTSNERGKAFAFSDRRSTVAVASECLGRSAHDGLTLRSLRSKALSNMQQLPRSACRWRSRDCGSQAPQGWSRGSNLVKCRISALKKVCGNSGAAVHRASKDLCRRKQERVSRRKETRGYIETIRNDCELACNHLRLTEGVMRITESASRRKRLWRCRSVSSSTITFGWSRLKSVRTRLGGRVEPVGTGYITLRRCPPAGAAWHGLPLPGR